VSLAVLSALATAQTIKPYTLCGNWAVTLQNSVRMTAQLAIPDGRVQTGIIPVGEVLRTTKGTLLGTTWPGPHNSRTWGYGTVWSYVPKPLLEVTGPHFLLQLLKHVWSAAEVQAKWLLTRTVCENVSGLLSGESSPGA